MARKQVTVDACDECRNDMGPQCGIVIHGDLLAPGDDVPEKARVNRDGQSSVTMLCWACLADKFNARSRLSQILDER